MNQYEAGSDGRVTMAARTGTAAAVHDVLQKDGSTFMMDGQWLVSVIVVLLCVAAVIGVVLYLNTYFS